MLGLVIEALVVIVDRDRQHLLRMALTDHVIVEDLADFLRGRNAVARLHQRGFVLLADDIHAQFDAFVADEYGGTRDQFADFMLALATERAIQRVLGVARADLTHSYLRPPFDPVARPIHSGANPDLNVDRANSVPKKTLLITHRANHGLFESPTIISDPLQPTMLTPDYQEFANRARIGHRDNTVISGIGTGRSGRNRRNVARLPRRQTSTKAELSAHAGHRQAADGQICR